ncbi:ATP-binding protein [Microbacterium sp. P01]|uniref:sensor histidine kinase n=1 Tax=unclassified Microbacterium TaxID=2609290 RepID=UPI0036727592
MRFSTQLLLWQLASVIAVVGVCTAVFTWLGVQQLRAEAESASLSIARTVAADGDVRALVARYSADPGTPEADALRGGDLETLAAGVERSTGALFVVITDDRGIRLAHPDPARLGEEVSTSYADALAGRENVAWESGTLGESARAKVPVYGPGTTTPVGEVSVGFARASVFDDLPPLLIGVGVAALLALGIGALVAFFVRRRLERLTLGVQPEELAALVQNQAAVLDGAGEGVVAYTVDGHITVANTAARRLLGLGDIVGRGIRDLDLPADLVAAMGVDSARDADAPIVLGDHVVFVDARRVSRAGRDLGVVVVIRDRTDVVRLSERLESVATMTNALRAQRHEFANRLHVAAGLIDARRVTDARAYLDEVLEVSRASPAEGDVAGVDEPFLRSLLEALSVDAAERGVRLHVGERSLVLGQVAAPEDVATVLGNLVDNAIRAAIAAPEPRWVDVELLDDGDTLVVTVADSGGGVADAASLFDRLPGVPDVVAGDDVHGHGIGLPLARDIARRFGGDLWLVEPGGGGSGAVFTARIPRTMAAGASGGVSYEQAEGDAP